MNKNHFAYWLKPVLLIFLLFGAIIPVNSVSSEAGYTQPRPFVAPSLSVNGLADQHPISPYIYGINFYGTNFADFTTLMQDIKLPVNRWGGNAATRYNYLTNSFNSGSDYFFEGNPNTANDPALGDPSESDDIITRDKANGTKTIIQMPMIGYVSKSHDPHICGFSVTKYIVPQQQTDTPFAPDCGNGVKLSDGSFITNNDPLDTSIAINQTFATGWVNYLKNKYGMAANGGVQFYELDNEPSDWYETHRDVHPGRLTYDELRDRTYQYAPAIKAADPTAKTIGPSNFGYGVYADSLVTGDKAAHGDKGFSEWYLEQMKLYEQNNGVRILDYFDQHYYPAQPGVTLAPAGNAATQALRLRSTRSLWDSSYFDESWIEQSGFPPVQLIPTFRTWIAANYPGTKTSISEYNFGGLEDINGALTQADVLGIFGREQLDMATLWSGPTSTQPGAFAFRMYRNYDGAHSTFGDSWVRSTSSDQSILAIYGAKRSSDNALTLMIINKTGSPITSNLSLSNYYPASTARVYRYSAANLNAIVRQPDLAVNQGGFNATYPASSITLVVLGAAPPPLVVKIATDDGNVNTADTLSYALQHVVVGQSVTFDLPPIANNTIMVSQALPAVKVGTNIYAPCNAPITLDGSSTPSNLPLGIIGLLLSGNNQVQGIVVTRFSGTQIKNTGGGNQLKCVKAIKT